MMRGRFLTRTLRTCSRTRGPQCRVVAFSVSPKIKVRNEMTASIRYHAFLLRDWREQGADDQAWRLSLQDAARSEHYGFCTLDELCAFLRYHMDGALDDEYATGITATHDSPPGEPRR